MYSLLGLCFSVRLGGLSSQGHPSLWDRGIRNCKEILEGSLLLFSYIATMHICEFWLKNAACLNL